ncbi:hypothetical protein QQF64_001904, partial [Cirrhinus molitorella]
GTDEGFIKKTLLIPIKSSISHQQLGCSIQDENMAADDIQANVEDETAGVQAVCEIHAVLRYEYHVLYSCSYQIPVLYFRASTLDGRPLSLEEVWSYVHPNYRQRLQQGPWDTLTQQEHPLLGQAFFMLHPCRTEEFMKPALELAQAENKKVNYIVTWLSVVGPVVGLDVPLSYSTETQRIRRGHAEGLKGAKEASEAFILKALLKSPQCRDTEDCYSNISLEVFVFSCVV